MIKTCQFAQLDILLCISFEAIFQLKTLWSHTCISTIVIQGDYSRCRILYLNLSPHINRILLSDGHECNLFSFFLMKLSISDQFLALLLLF